MTDTTLTTTLKDQLLIAMPMLTGSIFAESVTYICDHNDEGAMGLIINRPLDISAREVFEHLEITEIGSHADTTVLAGGPVETSRGFVLHRGGGHWESTMALTDSLQLTTSLDILSAIAHGEGPEDYLLALGYAGWGAGQLEQEIQENSWLTLPVDERILFETPVERRYAAATQSLGIDPGLISSQIGHA